MDAPVRLTDADLDGIVQSALRGDASLDALVTRALWGGDPPPIWREWPPLSRALWSLACQRYQAAVGKPGFGSRKLWTANTLTLAASWDLMVALAPDPKRWWRLPGVTWTEIAGRMGSGVSRRVASYRLTSLGWRFRGVGMVPDRQVAEAPCGRCGRVWPPLRIFTRVGPCCWRAGDLGALWDAMADAAGGGVT